MARNQEIKFICEDACVPEGVFRALELVDERTIVQEDIYAFANSHYFKLRINDGVPAKLLRYKRLTSPVLRESSYEAYELSDDSSRQAARFVFESIPIAGTVRKTRRQFEAKNLLLNVDTVYEDEWQTTLYHVVEIECFQDALPPEEVSVLVDQVLSWFNVEPYKLLPYSNVHMVNMMNNSKRFRNELRNSRDGGQLFLIDGGSATGKSTIKKLLVEKFKLGYAPRDTTRASRPDDLLNQDYIFVSRADFNRKALLGDYIEFRDFLFDMSYGLSWSKFVNPLLEGKDMMALINLGNGYFTKRLFPEAKLVLLYADVQIVRARLQARGAMTREQIDERIENNRLARTYLDAYDLAIDTSMSTPEEVAEQVLGS